MDVDRMLPAARRARLLQELSERGAIHISTLSRQLGVSPMTLKQTRRRVYAVVAIVAGLGLGAVVGAHSVLKSSDPADSARLKRLPEVVKLSFSEPVELTFSVFKVYPLPAPAGTPSDLKQLSGVAAELV